MNVLKGNLDKKKAQHQDKVGEMEDGVKRYRYLRNFEMGVYV